MRIRQDADISINFVCLSNTATSPTWLFSLQSKRRDTGEPVIPLSWLYQSSELILFHSFAPHGLKLV